MVKSRRASSLTKIWIGGKHGRRLAAVSDPEHRGVGLYELRKPGVPFRRHKNHVLGLLLFMVVPATQGVPKMSARSRKNC